MSDLFVEYWFLNYLITVIHWSFYLALLVFLGNKIHEFLYWMIAFSLGIKDAIRLPLDGFRLFSLFVGNLLVSVYFEYPQFFSLCKKYFSIDFLLFFLFPTFFLLCFVTFFFLRFMHSSTYLNWNLLFQSPWVRRIIYAYLFLIFLFFCWSLNIHSLKYMTLSLYLDKLWISTDSVWLQGLSTHSFINTHLIVNNVIIAIPKNIYLLNILLGVLVFISHVFLRLSSTRWCVYWLVLISLFFSYVTISFYHRSPDILNLPFLKFGFCLSWEDRMFWIDYFTSEYNFLTQQNLHLSPMGRIRMFLSLADSPSFFEIRQLVYLEMDLISHKAFLKVNDQQFVFFLLMSVRHHPNSPEEKEKNSSWDLISFENNGFVVQNFRELASRQMTYLNLLVNFCNNIITIIKKNFKTLTNLFYVKLLLYINFIILLNCFNHSICDFFVKIYWI